MFDPCTDPALYASQVERECYAAVVARIAARQLGEAFAGLDLEEQPKTWLEAA
jgi:hypothetical protein